MKFPRPEFDPERVETPEFPDLISKYVAKVVKAELDAVSALVGIADEDETKPGIKITTRYLIDDATNSYRAEQTLEFDEDVPRGEVHYTTDTSGFGVGPYQP